MFVQAAASDNWTPGLFLEATPRNQSWSVHLRAAPGHVPAAAGRVIRGSRVKMPDFAYLATSLTIPNLGPNVRPGTQRWCRRASQRLLATFRAQRAIGLADGTRDGLRVGLGFGVPALAVGGIAVAVNTRTTRRRAREDDRAAGRPERTWPVDRARQRRRARRARTHQRTMDRRRAGEWQQNWRQSGASVLNALDEAAKGAHGKATAGGAARKEGAGEQPQHDPPAGQAPAVGSSTQHNPSPAKGHGPVEQELTDFKLLRSGHQHSDKLEAGSSHTGTSEDRGSASAMRQSSRPKVPPSRSDHPSEEKFETASSLAVPSEDKWSEEHLGSLPKPRPLR